MNEPVIKLVSKNNILDTQGRTTADSHSKGAHVPFGETTVEKADYGNRSCSATICNAWGSIKEASKIWKCSDTVMDGAALLIHWSRKKIHHFSGARGERCNKNWRELGFIYWVKLSCAKAVALSPFVHISPNLYIFPKICCLFLVKSYRPQLCFQLTGWKSSVSLFSLVELTAICTNVTKAKSGLYGCYTFECRRGQLREMVLLSEHENKNVNRKEVILLNL